jgi:hypothetical protein
MKLAVFVKPLPPVSARLMIEADDIPAVDIPAVQSVVALNQHSQSVLLLLLLHRVAVHSCGRTCFQEEGSPHIVYKMSCFIP